MAKPQLAIIDCDPGVDDSMALILAFGSPEIKVIATTIVMGNNNDVNILADNACRVIAMCKEKDILVVKGCDKPLAGAYHGFSGIMVHGDNGVGNVKVPPLTESDRAPLQHSFTDAADYLIKTCMASPGEIVLITLGPLTNIATAIQREPKFASSVKSMFMMGGAFSGRGNKSPVAEANVGNDPEAAKAVFDAFPGATVAHLGVTHQLNLGTLLGRLRGLNPAGDYICDITAHYVKLLNSWGELEVPVHDSTALMAFLRPDIFKVECSCVDVELEGKLTRGMTVADWLNHWKRDQKTRILQSVDTAAYYDEYVARVARSKCEVNPVLH